MVDKSGESVRMMFGEIAPRYDFMNHFLSGGTDYYWRYKAVRKTMPVKAGPILDVCTGTGDLAFAYWDKVNRKIPVIGTDFTHEMLVLANEKLSKRSWKEMPQSRLEFIEADSRQLPFPDDTFEIVSVAFGLRNISDTEEGLREMARVCQPGGKVVVLEFSMPKNPVLNRAYGWYFRNVLPTLGKLFVKSTKSAYNYLPESVSEFPYGEALAEIMKECGLERVDLYPLTAGIATLYVGHKAGEKVEQADETSVTEQVAS